MERFLLKISLTFLIGLINSFIGFSQRHHENFDVYLLIGQSNMAGRGPIPESNPTQENILMLDSLNQWVLAKHPLHFDKDYAAVGPGISFAENMRSNTTDKTIGLIPCAWGGSPISVWQKGANYFNHFPYNEAIARAKIAMQSGTLKGVLWHQGESDNTPEKAKVYLEKLKQLVVNIRKDLDLPNLPFIAGEIGRFNKTDFINAEINKLPKYVDNTAVVSSEGLNDKGDKLHFNTESANSLGGRYAEAMKALQQKLNPKPTVVLTFDDAEISHYTNVAPTLLEYGFNATFFICEFPIKTPNETDEYMRWNQILALHKMGFEIGNHTGHHKNLTKLNETQVEEEILYIEKQCDAFGIPKPVTLAYPGNRHDPISQQIVKRLGYEYARAGGSKLYNPKLDSNFAIPSFTVASTEKLSKRVTNVLNNLQPNQTLVLTFHGVPDLVHPDYSTTLNHFKEILETIRRNNYRVIALQDLKK